MSTQSRLLRRASAVAGLGAIAAMGLITAGCAGEEKAPETSTTTTTTTTSPAASVSPTEKAPRIDPQAPNQFTPSVLAPPASQVQPGEHGRHVQNGS
jgi:hypothetical protein